MRQHLRIDASIERDLADANAGRTSPIELVFAGLERKYRSPAE